MISTRQEDNYLPSRDPKHRLLAIMFMRKADLDVGSIYIPGQAHFGLSSPVQSKQSGSQV